jgi:hypothetical protein
MATQDETVEIFGKLPHGDKYELVCYPPVGIPTSVKTRTWPSLKTLHTLIGGRVELVPCFPGALDPGRTETYVHEEGVLLGLQPNETFGNGFHGLVGNVVTVRWL